MRFCDSEANFHRLAHGEGVRRHSTVPAQNLHTGGRGSPNRFTKGGVGPVIGGPKGHTLHLDHQEQRRLLTCLPAGYKLLHMLDAPLRRGIREVDGAILLQGDSLHLHKAFPVIF